jgi:hypothetical protein
MKENENVERKLRVQYCKKDVLSYINSFCTLETSSLTGNIQKRPLERIPIAG